MAIFTTETEVTTDVVLDIEVTVQDQDGNEIECDVDGNDLELCVQINIQKIKEELEEEVRDELRQEIEDQFVADIAESVNPFQELADLLAKTGRFYEMRQNRIKANTKLSIERNLMKSDVITGLKTENVALRREVEELNTRLSAVVTIKIDPPKEDDEEAKKEAIATQDIPLGQTRITVSDQ